MRLKTNPGIAASGAAFPSFIEPCLPTLTQTVPAGPDWLHEIKYDGYRTQAHLKEGAATLYTRRGYDWTGRFRTLAQALSRFPAKTAVLDGEVVVPDDKGIPDFEALYADLAANRTERLLYYVFDLLYLDGQDLRRLPLIERKLLLGDRTGQCDAARLRYSEHLEGNAEAMFEHACEMRLEGVVSKERNSRYRSGRSESWLKAKCVKRDTFPIIAFVEKLGASPRKIASLYVGRWQDGKLLYGGKARSGYTEETARDIRERLDPLIIGRSPLAISVKKPKATWVKPDVEAEIAYSLVTADGLLREAVFRGIREDLASPAPGRPKAPRRAKVPRPGFARPENILQLLPEAVAPSHDELARYWHRVGNQALRYLGRRPLKLVRNVRGTVFYHKGLLPAVPGSVRKLRIKKREGGEGTRLWVDSVEGLLGLVEFGVIELHPWNATVDDIERADQLAFDLDPGPGIAWDFVCETALALRDLLQDEGLSSWPKVTGGKGLHVMAGLSAKPSHDEAHRHSLKLASRLRESQPDRYTLAPALQERRGKLFIDYLRNGRGTTAAGAFSPRAKAGFPIAAPVTWNDVARGVRPDAFTMKEPPGRRRL